EVQMPLPPAEAKKKQEEYEESLKKLFDMTLKRSDVREAIRASGQEREKAIAALAGTAGSGRKAALERAAAQYDKYVAALEAYRAEKAKVDAGSGDPEALKNLEYAMQDAQDLAEDAEDEVLQNELDPAQFARILDLADATRDASLDDLKKRLPELATQIDQTVEEYKDWKSGKGYLDGPADLQRLISGAGVLEFRILTQQTPDNAAKISRYRENLAKYGPDPRPGDTDHWFRIDNPVAFFNLDSAAGLETYDVTNPTIPAVLGKQGEDYYVLATNDPTNCLLHDERAAKWKLKNAYPSQDQSGAPNVVFEFDAVGASRFADLTGRNLQNQLCILLDDVAYSSATIQSKISRVGTISGRFTQEKVMYLVQAMQSGSLPARLKDTPLSERTIGSSLGRENLHRALRAAVWGLAATALFMAIYYFICGCVADVALLMNVVLVLAAMAMLGARFTLPGIAGVILTIGMVVDANVLIFERMREEKERGSSLRMIIKNGYDKALSTIIDSNITTLLTSLILYYVGSEEIKGFGLTLGWGIVMSLFTSLFVTRTIFAFLVKYRLLTDIKMLQLIKVPTIDWYGKRKLFALISIVTIAIGMVALFSRTKDELFDVEFNGGVAAEVELETPIANENVIHDKLAETAKQIAAYSDKVAAATAVEAGPSTVKVSMPGVPADLIAAIITEPLEDNDLLVRGGITRNPSEDAVTVRIEGDKSPADIQQFVRNLATPTNGLPIVQRTLGRANLGIFLDAGDSEKGRFWNVTTTEKNKRLVQYALEQALGDDLVRQPSIAYTIRGDENTPYPITDASLVNVIPDFPADVDRDVTDFRGGAAMWFDNLDPPQTLAAIQSRLQGMRLQPGYQDFPYRRFEVIGVRQADQASDGGAPLYESVALVVGNPPHRYEDAPQLWVDDYARKEMQLATATLDTEQSLRRVSQFKPQIAAQSTQKAIMSLVLSWAMIIAYLWVRFGRVSYGVAGVVALIHDVLIGLGFIGFAWWIGGSNSPLGQFLLIDNFKIDMTIVAAFLTIIGYSINDSIVIFDRIREVRGRLGVVTPQIINDSLNQTMSRTIITGFTTFLVLLMMYILGGSSIRGFTYCMLVGIFTGTYSSIAIAAPLLMWGIRTGERKAKAVRPATA
ncbi:MAG: protein translocase subunit SecD, partial [Phycisphaerae bacterium]